MRSGRRHPARVDHSGLRRATRVTWINPGRDSCQPAGCCPCCSPMSPEAAPLVRAGPGSLGMVLTGGNVLHDGLERRCPRTRRRGKCSARSGRAARAAGPGRLSRHAGDPAAFRDSATPCRQPCGAWKVIRIDDAWPREVNSFTQFAAFDSRCRSMSGRSPPTASSRRFAIRPGRSRGSCGTLSGACRTHLPT